MKSDGVLIFSVLFRTMSFIFFLSAAAASAPGPVMAAGGGLEADVKAAYILNIMKFVDWEPSKNKAGEPIKLLVAGTDSVADVLEKISGAKIGDRPLAVVRITAEEIGASPCHLLYIGRSEKDRSEELLKPLKGSGVLTVSDIPDFARRGGIIGFIIENGRVRIEINVNESKRAGLKFGAKLLEVARLIK